eukprot:1002086-Amphidinium_carterae.1
MVDQLAVTEETQFQVALLMTTHATNDAFRRANSVIVIIIIIITATIEQSNVTSSSGTRSKVDM